MQLQKNQAAVLSCDQIIKLRKTEKTKTNRKMDTKEFKNGYDLVVFSLLGEGERLDQEK